MHHRRRSRRRDKRNVFPCGCCWDYNERKNRGPQIDEDEVCMGKAKSKKPRPKKDKCPVNRVHEWYRETVIEEYWVRWTRPGRKMEAEFEVKTCIHCWKAIKKRIYMPYVSEWRLRKRPIPKRPVKEIYDA
jgi:hypothetical protein